MYHAVTPSPLTVKDWCFLDRRKFAEQAAYLKQHFDVVPLSEAGRRGEKRPSRGRPRAAITFDDGFQNNFDVAFPILEELGLPASVFLVTDLVGTEETVWFCRLHDAVSRSGASRLTWQGRDFPLDSAAARSKTSADLQGLLKELAAADFSRELQRILASLEYHPSPIAADSPFRMLNRESVRAMAGRGIEFGAHTCSHAILSKLPVAEQRREIEDSLKAVTELTGRECKLFAFPNGRARDYQRKSVEILKDLGVAAGVTTVPGPNSEETPPLELRRYGIGADMTFPEFRFTAHHANHALRKALRV